MAQEIERKFLVCGEFMAEVTESAEIVQGYLSRTPDHTIRIRIMGNRGYITVKGNPGKSGIERYEWEKEISVEDAKELLMLCEPFPVHKTRYKVPSGGHIFEVDVFHGENEGLIVAELELKERDEKYEKPEWLGVEVTGDPRYYNSNLSVRPFRGW